MHRSIHCNLPRHADPVKSWLKNLIQDCNCDAHAGSWRYFAHTNKTNNLRLYWALLHDDLASHKFQNIGQGFELAAQKLRCQWCWTVVSHTIAGLSTPYSPAPFFGTGGPSFWYRTSVLLGKLYVRIKCVNIHTCLCIQERSPSCIFVHSCICLFVIGFTSPLIGKCVFAVRFGFTFVTVHAFAWANVGATLGTHV